MHIVQGLGFIAVVGISAVSVGRMVLRRWYRDMTPSIKLAVYGASGLLLISHLIFLMSTLHVASNEVFLVLFSILALISLNTLLGLRKKRASFFSDSFVTFCSSNKWFIISCTFYVTWITACATLPASARDELIYHLDIPKRMTLAHGFPVFQNNIYAYFPQLGEMLFFFGATLSGEFSTKLFHLLGGLFLALALYGFCRRFCDEKLSFLSVAIFFTVPSVMVTMSWAYVDVTFTLFAFLSLIAWLSFLENNENRWAILAGVMAGGAAAVKYTGLQWIVLLLILGGVGMLLKRSKRSGVEGMLWLLGIGLLIPMPYLLRNWMLTGWPVFPFQLGGFELTSGINWDPERARLLRDWLIHFGTPLGQAHIGHMLAAPVLVFLRGQFNEYTYYEGVAGPIFLLGLYFTFRLWNQKRLKGLIFFTLLFFFYWMVTTKQVRFLFPVLCTLSVLISCGLKKSRSRFVTGVAVGLVLLNVGFGIHEVSKKYPLPYWLGTESRKSYLARQLPVYPMYQKANATLGPSDKLYLIDMKNYGYYLDCNWEGDFVFEKYRLEQLLKTGATPEEIYSYFADREVTHIMMDLDMLFSPEWGLPLKTHARFRLFLDQHTHPLVHDSSYLLAQLTSK